MKKSLIDRLSNTWVDRLISRAWAHLDVAVLSVFNGKEAVAPIRNVRARDGAILCRPSELFMIRSLAAAQTAVPGDFAEVGVYKGASAQLICEVKRDKPLHLFDTFEGLPEKHDMDIRFSKDMFKADLEAVRARLGTFDGVQFHPGLFPQTAGPVAEKTFAFVHLDVDIYQSTLDGLQFFYDRMNPGGIILSHDYPSSRGVKQAFDEFFKNRKERIINLPMSQGLVIKQG